MVSAVWSRFCFIPVRCSCILLETWHPRKPNKSQTDAVKTSCSQAVNKEASPPAYQTETEEANSIANTTPNKSNIFMVTLQLKIAKIASLRAFKAKIHELRDHGGAEVKSRQAATSATSVIPLVLNAGRISWNKSDAATETRLFQLKWPRVMHRIWITDDA